MNLLAVGASVEALFAVARSPMQFSAITYALGRAIYVSLTNRCNAQTLIATRGPSFAMPQSSGFTPLPEGFEPTADEVVAAVRAQLDLLPEADGPVPVVFAGLGEPLLRLDVLLTAASSLNHAYMGGVNIRVSSNGLVPRHLSQQVARSLREAGVRKATIALASADDAQYDQLLIPRGAAVVSSTVSDSEVEVPKLADMCTFVRALVSEELEVECATVAHPSVDLTEAEVLARSLGTSFRCRSYHS
mgnify:CR=1 FL=1|eukprot:scaffold24722_cov35-Tisochrysis_lutea.AAC.1